MIAPIVLTCGDPNGVGIDLALLAAEKLRDIPFFMLGDINHVAARKHSTNFIQISGPSETLDVPEGVLPILHHEFAHQPTLRGAQPNNAYGIIEVIERAVKMVQDGQASAICTNPIHKKVLKDGAQFVHPGHTEFLAHLAGVDQSVMMLLCDELRVVPVTIHIAVADVPSQLTASLLKDTILITHDALFRDFGMTKPRIAIAGLNPHAGEDGTFGREEIEVMAPVITDIKNAGINITDPMSADTMFHAEARNRYDVAICMYHDQALIPIKTLDFHGGVNTTLGLPFIRTSPDHGTAFDLAGTKDANPSSLIAALKCANEMALKRMNNDA